MLTFLCVVAGVIATFYQIGYIVKNFSSPTARAAQIIIIVALELISLVLAAFFVPAIVSYMFTFAFTNVLMYGISNLYNILHVKV